MKPGHWPLAWACLAWAGVVWARPIPVVQPPGSIQPLAPGQREASPLPQLDWPRHPAIRKVEFAGNGHIEVAHALLLLDVGQQRPAERLLLAQQAVAGAFRVRPGLAEVDVSCYAALGYRGYGGPLPQFTASVPRQLKGRFAALRPKTQQSYARLWSGSALPIQHPPSQTVIESEPHFSGSPAQLEEQRRFQAQGLALGHLRQGLFFGGNPAESEAALTFDDAPHPLYEPLLLDDLQRAGIKATFFCIGRNARAYPYFVRDMAKQGHELANHTYHHIRLPELAASQVDKELTLTTRVLEQISHQRIRFFRPPGGDYSLDTLAISRKLGLITAFWTDDPGDFDHPEESVLESRLLDHLRNGGIVLLHDNVEETINVLPAFLKLARARGFRLTTVGELAGF